jgi:hypothetical protein
MSAERAARGVAVAHHGEPLKRVAKSAVTMNADLLTVNRQSLSSRSCAPLRTDYCRTDGKA